MSRHPKTSDAPRAPRLAARLPALTLAAIAVATLAPRLADASAAQLRVAVLEFANASSDKGLQSLGKGLQSMLTTDLSKVKALSLIERGRLQAILAEQKLGRSGKVDRKTAARIGKLAGASHLLAGTYTVHGARMRLDARLFAVEGGRVLLGEQITGERDAFFELEKSLVRKLIKALGVKLKPKERAGVARIHTADFAAFKRFSGGVAHFDAKRYDKALDAMRAAMKLDADFGLARVTLGQYEQLVARMRAKADKLDLSKRELAALAADKVAQNDSLVAQRLVAIASEKGKAKRFRRLAALTFLIGFYNPYARNHGRIMRFQNRFDRMAVRGRIDTLARRYFTEARAIFPEAPLFTRGQHPPQRPQQVDKRIAGLAGALQKGMEYRRENRDRGLIRNISRVTGFLKLMAADRREAIRLHQVALKALVELNAAPREKQDMLEHLSARYLAVGDVASASGALTRMSATMTNANRLKSIATRVEKLGVVAKLLARSDKKALVRELLAAADGRIPSSLRYVTPGPPSRRLLDALTDARRPTRWWSHRDPYWYFGSLPAHLIQGERLVITGPRKDGLRSDALRYYRPARQERADDVLIVLGRSPRDRLDVTFELNRTPARDFWPIHANREATGPGDLKLDPGSPEMSLVFGLHGIDTDNVQDPVTRKRAYPRPTQGLAVRFGGDGVVALVELGEKAPAQKLRERVMRAVVLKKRSGMPTGGSKGARVKVRIRAAGKSLHVTVGPKSTTWPLPNAQAVQGYIGLHFRGFGYGEVRALRAE